jgi:hypothetical protein
MVVDEHLAPGRKTGQCEDAYRVATSDHSRGLDDAVRIDGASKADFSATGEPDCGSYRPRGR